jgi:hypothetical protein
MPDAKDVSESRRFVATVGRVVAISEGIWSSSQITSDRNSEQKPIDVIDGPKSAAVMHGRSFRRNYQVSPRKLAQLRPFHPDSTQLFH